MPNNIQKFVNFFGIITCSLLVLISQVDAQEQKTFNDLEEVLQLVKDNYHSFGNAEIQTKLADLSRKTAIANVLNPRIPASIQWIDNTKQQVLFLPGEAFGQPGTYRSVTTGQKYTSLISLQPQFEVLNIVGIAQIKSAKINQQLTDNENKINEFKLYNQITPIYFNILSYQAQIEIVQENIKGAETILKIAQNRFNENVGRKQDVNEAEVNLITLKNNLEQLEFNVNIQKESLAIFLENNYIPHLSETVWTYESSNQIIATNNTLQIKNIELQQQLLQQDIKVNKAQHWPMLTLISSFNWQNLSSDFFYSSNSNSIDYNYIGLKLSMDLPTSVAKISSIKNKNLQLNILKNNFEHVAKQSETDNRLLILDYEKSISQLENLQKIVVLKEDTYSKSFNQYQENILSLDDLLISYNNMLAAKLNVVTALANIGFYKSKIDINNKF
ncbi:MAG TPA: TolC family protein [Chitinophagales bacterium]|nr:TolC family protein [Chitinophagales bacterium]